MRLEELRSMAIQFGRNAEYGRRAIEANTRILEMAPGDVAALNRRGRCYYERGAYEVAKADYEQALSLHPSSTVARKYLQKIEWKISGRELGATMREREHAAARTRRRLADDRAQRRRQQAEVRRRQKEAEKARMLAEDLQEVEGLNSFVEARSLGVAARGGRHPNYPLAIAAFRRAFELDRRRYDVLTMLAATYRAYKQPMKAEKVYRWLLNREESMVAKTGLAAVYADMGKPVKARELYEEVLHREPANSYALMGLGRTLYQLGFPEQAAKTFEKAAEFAEGRENVHKAVIELRKVRETYQESGDVDRAEWIDSVLDRLRVR